MTDDDIKKYFAPNTTQEEVQKLYHILQDVDDALSDCFYFLCWGALLGFVRFGHLMTWDDDIDLCCLDTPSVQELQRRLPSYTVKQEQYIKIFAPEDNGYPFLEINPAWEEEGRICTKSAFELPDDRFPEELVFPLQRGKFGPVEVNLPNDPEKFVLFKYGDCLEGALPPVWDHKREQPTHYPQERVPLDKIARHFSSKVNTRWMRKQSKRKFSTTWSWLAR